VESFSFRSFAPTSVPDKETEADEGPTAEPRTPSTVDHKLSKKRRVKKNEQEVVDDDREEDEARAGYTTIL